MLKQKPSIVIIDDSRLKRMFLIDTLKGNFSIHAFESGAAAMPHLAGLQPQCILLDIEMPVENGFQVLEKIKADPELATIPVIFITSSSDKDLERRGLENGAVDFVGNQLSPEVIHSRVSHHVELYGYRCHLEEKVRENMQTIQELQDAIMVALSDLVECRDSNTAGHAQRTYDYVERLIQQMLEDGSYKDELNQNYVRDIIRASPLHDIGKVGVADAILNKPGRLNEEEFAIMKRHTVFGATAIHRAMRGLHDRSFLSVLRDISFSHHEKWDGTGYPLGLQGTSIPLCGRIMAIPDVYDALVSRRPYKEPMPHTKAVQIIAEGSGTHFDPLVCEAFLRCQADFETISHRHREKTSISQEVE